MFLCACSITYNGSMESPVPLYPTDCPPPYEAVMGQRDPSQVSSWKGISSSILLVFTVHSCRRLNLWTCLSLAYLRWRAFCRERDLCGVQWRRYTLSIQCCYVLYVQLVCTFPSSLSLLLFRSFSLLLSVCFSVSGDSGSLLMSEIVDIPDDSSPSEDSCVLEVAFAVRARARGVSEGGEGIDYNITHPSAARCCFRGERSNSCSSPSTYNTSTFR